jgi:hypothetical protein
MTFPARSPGMGGVAGSSVLDAPPPNPTNPAMSMAQDPGLTSSRSGPLGSAPARELPPEVLMGMVKTSETLSGMLDDLAQMAPDCAAEFAAAKDMLQRGISKLVLAGGAPSTLSQPTRTFPGAAPFPSQNGALA